MNHGVALPNHRARAVCMALTAMWAAGLLVVISMRLGFALDLEWMEGGALLQARRIQLGQSIYAAPSVDYVPFLYTPLYSYVLAGLGWLFPLDYGLGRVVSVLATAVTGAAIWRAVEREGKPRAHAWTGVGLFLAGYVFTFRWFDLARADMMALALATWGAVLLREAWGHRGKTVLAAMLMGAAFWTKQTGFLFAATGVLAGVFVAPRQLWLYVVTVVAIGFGGVAWGQALTDGWLWTYIYELHQAHAFNHERFRLKTWGMFVHAAPFVVALLVGLGVRFWWPHLAVTRRFDAAGTVRVWTRLRSHRGLAHWFVFAVAGLLASAIGYSTQWAEPNAFLPGVCFGAIFVAVALPSQGRAEVWALGACAVQLLFAAVIEPLYQPIQRDGWSGLARSYVWQDLSRTIPSSQQRQAAVELREQLTHAGSVLALQRPWWSVIAGGDGHVASMNLSDVSADDRRRLRSELADAVRRGKFAAIYLEGEAPKWLRSSLAPTYALAKRRTRDDRVRPMSGYMSVAGMVSPYRAAQLEYRLPQPRSLPAGATVVADFEDSTRQGFDLDGEAFGRAPVRSVHRDLDAVAGAGGEYFLSSAASRRGLEAKGTARSAPFTLPAAGGRLELLIGRSGRRRGLSVQIERVFGSGTQPLPVDAPRDTLVVVTWTVPANWAGQSVRLQVVDDDDAGAVLVDDVWIVAPSPTTKNGAGEG